MSFFDQTQTGFLLDKLNSNLEKIQKALSTNIQKFLKDLFMGIGTFYYLIQSSQFINF